MSRRDGRGGGEGENIWIDFPHNKLSVKNNLISIFKQENVKKSIVCLSVVPISIIKC